MNRKLAPFSVAVIRRGSCVLPSAATEWLAVALLA